MPDKVEMPTSQSTTEPAKDRAAQLEQMRAALLWLRRLGEKLPEVDAAAIVRAGRDMAARGDD
jgi:hypothetical protein